MSAVTELPASQPALARASRFATAHEAAEYLNVSRSKVYLLIRDKKLSTAKIGKCRRIAWDSLTRYADSCIDS